CWRLCYRTGHRNEEHADVALGVNLALFVLRVDVQHLPALEWLTDRNDHPSTGLQLLEKIGWCILGGTGHDNDIETALHFRPAVIAVTHARMDVAIAERREDLADCLAKRLDDLDRVG